MRNCLLNWEKKISSNWVIRYPLKYLRFLFLIAFIVLSFSLFAQKIIKGRVSTGDTAIVGATVQVKGSNIATQTDADGNFTISIPSNATLLITSVGYSPEEVKVGNRSFINVQLRSLVQTMGEVVVVGYGTQKRTLVTSAISTVKGEELTKQPVADISNSLGGRVSGILFTQSSGEPGSDGSNILIRGIGTTGNSQPLVIIDGIPRNYSQLDPNSIETISILKDAAAVAPYGLGGANGVILITTKRGKSGKATLSYNGFLGFQNPTKLAKFADGFQYATLLNAAKANEGAAPVFSDYDLQKFKDRSDPDGHPNHDVLKELITPNTLIQSHNLQITGGNESVKYFTSVGYMSQQGMWGPSSYKRFNLNSNVDIKATQTTQVSLSINGRTEERNSPAIPTNQIFYQAFRTPPVAPVTFSNGLWGGWIGSSVYGNIFKSGYNKLVGYTMLTQLSIEQQLPFIKGLSVKAVLAYDFNPGNSQNPGSGIVSLSRTWSTPIPFYTVDTTQHPYVYNKAGLDGPSKPNFSERFDQNQAFTYQGYINYNNTFGKSSVSGLVVLEARNTKYNVFGAARLNYDVLIPQLNVGSSNPADITNFGSSSEAKQYSAIYRLSYSYNNRYLVELAGRYDGNYYFAPGNRFGFFPAASVGWRLSEENFIKDNFKWINNLKIRASYGQSGALAGAPFQYLTSYSLFSNSSAIGGTPRTGLVENSQPNNSITWERAKKTDVGFEATLFNGLLTVEADYFHEIRNNMLVSPNTILPAEYGIGVAQQNAGSMSNSGFEISLGISKKLNKDWQIGLNSNFSYAKNKLIQIFENTVTYNNPNRRVTGRSIGTQFGYRAIGYFLPSDFDASGNLLPKIATQSFSTVEPGDIRYEDVNGDGKIDQNDIVPIGNSNIPQIVYGVSPNVKFKNFDLSLLFQGAAKRDFYISGAGAWPFYSSSSATIDNLDYWTTTNQNARNPRITSSPTPNNTVQSSFWIQNGSYLRLKSFQLGYNLPITISKTFGSNLTRIYVAGQNVLTWTKLRNFDPEVSDTQGMYYPQQKVISFGLNVTF